MEHGSACLSSRLVEIAVSLVEDEQLTQSRFHSFELVIQMENGSLECGSRIDAKHRTSAWMVGVPDADPSFPDQLTANTQDNASAYN